MDGVLMIYEYKCKNCDKSMDVVKHHSKSGRDEYCGCGAALARVYTASVLKRSSFIAGFNPSFGKVFTNKGQQDNEIKRIQGETGKEIYEVGNNKNYISAPKRSFNIKSATDELRKRWRK